MKKILLYIIGAISIVSCTHKDLCLDHSHIVSLDVSFDWQHAPGASPESMSLYMFPEEGGDGMRYEFSNCSGGTIRIPRGSYKAFCINSDTEVIRYRNEDRFETFELITRGTTPLMYLPQYRSDSGVVPRADGTEDQNIAFSPDSVWSDRSQHIEIVMSDKPQRLVMSPRIKVSHCIIEIRNVQNLKYVEGITGALTGMTEGYLPGTDQLGHDTVTIPFDMTYSAEEGIIRGELSTFGHCADDIINHHLEIYAVMSDGEKRYYSYDVTDQIHDGSEGNGRPDVVIIEEIVIVLEDLILPKPITNGGGFKPEIETWDSVEVDIEM